MAISCEEILELYSLQIDGELDEVGQGRMRRHVSDCPECAPMLTAVQQVDQLFRSTPEIALPEGFAQRAVARALDEAAGRDLRIGVAILMIGTLLIGSLAVLGRVDLVVATVTRLLAPGLVDAVEPAIATLLVAATIGGEALLALSAVLRSQLLGPLLVPVIAMGMATAALWWVLNRTSPSRQPVSL